MASLIGASLHPSEQFERAVADAKVSQSDLNWIILEYLVSEGFSEAATKFAAEARISESKLKHRLSKERSDIRNAICDGLPLQAISLINASLPDFLDEHPFTHFKLLLAQLIELIRQCFESSSNDINVPIQFATDNLVPLAITNDDCLKEMEQAMSLLLFGKKGPPPGALPNVSLDLSNRVRLAEAVDSDVLAYLSLPQRPQVMNLLKTRVWAEKMAEQHRLDIPSNLPISPDEFDAVSNVDSTAMWPPV